MTTLRFVDFEIHPVKDFGAYAYICTDADADFWSVYGVLLNAHGCREYVAIGDFSCRDAAELIVELIRG